MPCFFLCAFAYRCHVWLQVVCVYADQQVYMRVLCMPFLCSIAYKCHAWFSAVCMCAALGISPAGYSYVYSIVCRVYACAACVCVLACVPCCVVCVNKRV